MSIFYQVLVNIESCVPLHRQSKAEVDCVGGGIRGVDDFGSIQTAGAWQISSPNFTQQASKCFHRCDIFAFLPTDMLRQALRETLDSVFLAESASTLLLWQVYSPKQYYMGSFRATSLKLAHTLENSSPQLEQPTMVCPPGDNTPTRSCRVSVMRASTHR